MARHIEGTDLPAGPRRLGLYRWEEWLDGRVWLIEPQDYKHTSLQSFRSTAYVAASREGLRLRTTAAPEGLYIQAYPRKVAA